MAAITTFLLRKAEVAAKRTEGEDSGGFGVRGSAPSTTASRRSPSPADAREDVAA
ncbi:hypothetical protein GGR47_002307 [Sphingomonas aquatilis]|jgi:hypothetical protein|uniref:Uncharacterized protein n=1 Tax=Sphingomonas aquatilis TaxID=93063 RepID=A0AAW3TSK3_9SPHN|nr:hypothetical protein [Sphingomonas aquatilis]